jgi:hypothetical protein
MATVKMIKGTLKADIFDSPETIAQARREGYSLVDPKEAEKHSNDLEALTKDELLDIAKQQDGFERKLAAKKIEEIIAWIRAAESKGPDNKVSGKEGKRPEDPDPTARAELIQAAIAKGFDEVSLGGLSDDEIDALLEPKE